MQGKKNNENKKQLYRLDDQILVRKCTLYDPRELGPGDCSNYKEIMQGTKKVYECRQNGLHYHCTTHPQIELEPHAIAPNVGFYCPRCEEVKSYELESELRSRALRALNREIFRGAQLIRVDDWYVHQLKRKIGDLPKDSNYWMKAAIEEDSAGRTMVILYVGHRDRNGAKAQFFIKPETGVLTHDFKDVDPATLLTRIDVTLKDRKLRHDYQPE